VRLDTEVSVGDYQRGESGMSAAGRVVKNTGLLSFGRLATLALGILFTALLSRHIGPEGYGKYAFAQSTVALLMIFVNLGFSALAIRDVAQRKEQAAQYFTNIVFLKILLAAIVFSLFLGMTWLKGSPSETTILVLLVGATMTLEALTDAAGSIFYAFERMGYDVVVQVVRAVTALGLGAGAIYLGGDLVQIVAVLAFANILKAVVSFALLSTKIVAPSPEVDIRFCKELVVASMPFALLIVTNTIFSNANVVMLRRFETDVAVGWFASALRVHDILLVVPAMFLTSIYPVLSRFYATGKESLSWSYRKAYVWGLILGLPMGAGIFLVADPIVSLIFGTGFQNASSILKLLSLVIAVSFCNNVNGATLNAMGRERLFAGLSTAAVMVVVALNWLLIPRFGYVGVALTYNIATVLGFVVYSSLCHRWLKLALPWKKAARVTLAALLMAIGVHYALQKGVNLAVVVLLIGPTVYGGTLWLLRVFTEEDVLLLKRTLKLA
jgi:O-antigen/teichoic acid export membrane protein